MQEILLQENDHDTRGPHREASQVRSIPIAMKDFCPPLLYPQLGLQIPSGVFISYNAHRYNPAERDAKKAALER